jgi:hypothetical protein
MMESTGLRAVDKFGSPDGKQAKVYFDREYGEFRVMFYDDGQYQSDADYHTDDKQDAISTAKHYLRESSLNEAKSIHQALATGYRKFKKS